MLVCPTCKIEYSKGQKYCGVCGASLLKLLLDIDEGIVKKDEAMEESEEVVVVCSKCGASHKKIINYCTYCGEKISDIVGIEPKKEDVKVPQKTVEVKIICPYCHIENEAGSKVCKNCGIELIEEIKKEEKKEEKELTSEVVEKKPLEEVKKIEKVEEKRSVGIKATPELDDTASLMEEETIFKCPNCNYGQPIGDEICIKCGSPLTIFGITPEISREKPKVEPKRVVAEPKTIEEARPPKVPEPPKPTFERKLEDKIKAKNLSVETPPIKPSKPIVKPKAEKIAKEIILPPKKVKRASSFEFTEKLIPVIISKVFIIGIIAIVVIAAIIITLPKFMNKEKKENIEVVTLPHMIEGIETEDLPIIMKGYGEFTLRTNIPVKIYIDNKFYGYTPLNNIILLSGFHDLRLVNEEYLVDDKRQIYIESGVPLEQELTLGHFGTISINATPWAEVYIDEKYIGQTPIANLRLTVGTYEIRFVNPKYPVKRRNVEIIEGVNTNISVEMKPSNY